ncbi:MAG: SpoIIE family protein phosphatase [Leptospiraceae bacterium]|nr:SpoIIE family protein phosphatase [Leptospiraceae bacterium]
MNSRLSIPRGKSNMQAWVLACLIVGGIVPEVRAEPVSLDGRERVSLLGVALYCITSDKATLDEVQDRKEWTPVQKPVLALEEGRALWMRLEFEGDLSEPAKYFLSAAAPWADSVAFFRNAGRENPQISGTGAFVDHRYSRPTLEFALKPGERATIFVRITSYRRVPSEFILYSESGFLQRQTRRFTLLGLFGGTIVMLLLLHGLMYGGLRDPLLSRHLLWIISVGVYFVFRTRLSLLILPAALAGYSQWMHTVAVCLAAIGAIRFGRYYLSLAGADYRVDLAARFFQYGASLPIFLLPLQADLAHEMAALAGLFMGPPMFIIALIGLRKGLRDSYLFLVAWSLPIFAAVVENISFVMGQMENRILLPLAFLAEFLLFSLVIRRKIQDSERKRISDEVTLNRVNQELGFARKIQRDLMPSSEHDLENARIQVFYEPQREVGGDYCDVVYPAADHLGLFVADVTGHGMTAALDAALVRLALRSVYREKLSAAETLAAMNAFLYAHLQFRFVSAIYCVLNLRTGMGAVAGAGHPPGLQIRREQDPLILESSGTLLGVLKDWEGKDTAISLEQGDRLFLYTDGLLQSEDRMLPHTQEDELHFARERKLFSNAPPGLKELLDRSREVRGGPATDDVAIIQLQYSGGRESI